nr:hypothetical protein CFP56_34426 [Quercus suber]
MKTTNIQAVSKTSHLICVSVSLTELLIGVDDLVEIAEDHPRHVTLLFQSFKQTPRDIPFPRIRMPVKTSRPPRILPFLIVNQHVDVRVGPAFESNIRSLLPNHSQSATLTVTRNINSLGKLQLPYKTLHSASSSFGLHKENQDRIFRFHLFGENLNCRG